LNFPKQSNYSIHRNLIASDRWLSRLMYLLSAIIYYTELRQHYLAIIRGKQREREKGRGRESGKKESVLSIICSNPIPIHYNIHLWMTFKALHYPLFFHILLIACTTITTTITKKKKYNPLMNVIIAVWYSDMWTTKHTKTIWIPPIVIVIQF